MPMPTGRGRKEPGESVRPASAPSPSTTTEQTYTPLPDGHIRLLILHPSQHNESPLRCRLIDYHLADDEFGTHPYEALSYVWGAGDHHEILFVGNESHLPVTRNLHAALTRLRHRALDRVLWVDAVCINQKDIPERNSQVQLMTKIYAYASRVVVWIESTVDYGPEKGSTTNSDKGLAELQRAAVESGSGPVIRNNKRPQCPHAVKRLIGQPWFQRVWVLQEVAAARHVVITSHSYEIDGHAFCLGLKAVSDDSLEEGETDEAHAARSAAYLIEGAILRPKQAPIRKVGGRFSLGIRSLGVLLDLYQRREATDRRDKLFALIGMASDAKISPKLFPDYTIPWPEVFSRVFKFFVGENAVVRTWEAETSVASAQGWILGKISKATPVESQDKVVLTVKIETKDGNMKDYKLTATSAQKGDYVCFMEGTENPIIARLNIDYWSVISVGVAFEPRQGQVLLNLPDISCCEFLLVWDWQQQAISQNLGTFDEFTHQRLMHLADPGDLAVTSHQTERMVNVASSLALAKYYRSAHRIYISIMDTLPSPPPPGQTRLRVLELSQLISNEPWDHWSWDWRSERVAIDQMLQEKPELYDAATSGPNATRIFLKWYGTPDQITGKLINDLARSTASKLVSADVMRLLLDFHSRHRSRQARPLEIPGEALIPISERARGAEEMMECLVTRDDINIRLTEKVMEAIARCASPTTMALLLGSRFGQEATITPTVVAAGAGQYTEPLKMVELFLENCGPEVMLTQEVLRAMVRNSRWTEQLIGLLVDLYDAERVFATGLVELVAAEGKLQDMKSLSEKFPEHVEVTDDVVEAASQCHWAWKEMRSFILAKRPEIGSEENRRRRRQRSSELGHGEQDDMADQEGPPAKRVRDDDSHGFQEATLRMFLQRDDV